MSIWPLPAYAGPFPVLLRVLQPQAAVYLATTACVWAISVLPCLGARNDAAPPGRDQPGSGHQIVTVRGTEQQQRPQVGLDVFAKPIWIHVHLLGQTQLHFPVLGCVNKIGVVSDTTLTIGVVATHLRFGLPA